MTTVATSVQSVPAQASNKNLLWLPTRTLWRREMVRFFRQRSRVIGALATPIIFWLLLGGGLNNNFVLPSNQLPKGAEEQAMEQVGYLAYFFPGTIVMIVLFTAIFSMFSVIEDRKEGFMQAVLVSPSSRLSIVLGKVLGCASIATIQGSLFMLAWPWIGQGSFGAGFNGATFMHMLLAIPAMFVLGVSLAALGLCLAWAINSTQGFHAIMNMLLFPMWFLCGAVFPIPKLTETSGAGEYIMATLMYLNPLTYGHAAFNAILTGHAHRTGLPGGLYTAGPVMLVFTALMLLLAARVVAGRKKVLSHV